MNINEKIALKDVQSILGEFPKADLPLALFPVRLETRFTQEAGEFYLCVRIYPDDIHLDSHEPLLTEEEVVWGQQLWEQIWRSGRDPAMEEAIQEELAERFGAGRAAWIAKTLKPLNPQDRSDEPGSLPVKPVYPEVETREETWTMPTQVKGLPDRWVLLAYGEDEEPLAAVSHPVSGELAAGFDPREPDPETPEGRTLLAHRDNDERLPLDKGMKWMVDFEEAIAAGMAFRIKLTSRAEAESGFDRLIVLGVDTQSTAQTLETLFDSHRYTDSLDFIPQGSPSNNTAEVSAQYSETEPEQESDFIAQAAEPSNPEDCNCHITANALGISSNTFAKLPHTVDREQADAQAMNAMLWPATWGYFLRYMINHADGHLSDETIESLRRYFIKFVRARGPIPALRVGHQPYGILPVTALDLYQASPDNEAEIFGDRAITLLDSLRKRWSAVVNDIPHIQAPITSENTSTETLSQTLADILGMSAVSETFLGRMALDGILYGVPSPGPNGLSVTQDASINQYQQSATGAFNDLEATPNLPNYSLPAASFVFTEPIVKITPDLDTEEPFDLAALCDRLLDDNRTFNQINNGFLTPEEEDEPLALITRHAFLLGILDTAYNLSRLQGNVDPATHRDPSLIGILSDPQTGQAEDTPTLLDLVARSPNELGLSIPGASLAEATVANLADSNHETTQILRDMRDGLNHLASIPVEQAYGLMGETLDLASHRLDAWITALATARLDYLRKKQATGIILGGYGWLENLKLKPASNQVPEQMGDRTPVSEIPADEEENGQVLYEYVDNGGYVAAPSINQAATAAILRSGYLNNDQRGADAPFAIDLSSERVRLAKWLLDGVRQGQDLAALLGYRFERGLQENNLAQYILPFRKLVPFAEALRGKSREEVVQDYRELHLAPAELGESAIESLEAQHVVDGLELKHLWDEERISFSGGENAITLFDGNDQTGIEAQLNQLVATVDAVSDLITAESVFQLTQGNEQLAGGTLDAIASGEVPPPNPEFIRTPRSGIAHTHRVSVIFSGDLQPLETWNINTFQKRAGIEPFLNLWLADLFGDARKIKVKIAYWDPDTDTEIEPIFNPVPLWNFLLSPLDMVFVATASETGRGSPLEACMTYRIMRSRPERIPPHAVLRFFYEREPDWADDEMDYGTFLELARAARELVTNIRALDARDLSSPEVESDKNFSAVQLNQRADSIVNFYTLARNYLAEAIENVDNEALDNLRVCIFRFFYVGLNEAVPVSAKDDEPFAKDNLVEQAKNILLEANSRMDSLEKLDNSINRSTASTEEEIEVDTKRIKLLFGKIFRFFLNLASIIQMS